MQELEIVESYLNKKNTIMSQLKLNQRLKKFYYI